MSRLSLQLLGPFTATYDGEPLTSFRTKGVQALLIYLACQPEPHRRESLMSLLWPEISQSSAQNSLRQALYHLRQAIPEVDGKDGGDPVPFLNADRQIIQVNREAAHELDVLSFERQLNGPQEGWPAAVALYRDDFLCDFYLPDSASFEEWVAARRADLKRQALEALDTLTTAAMQTNDLETAEGYARQQLAIDNLRESAHRQLMRLLALGGRRNEALAHYGRVEQLLDVELGARPAAATEALYQQLLSGEPLAAVTPEAVVAGRAPRVVGPCPYRGLAAFREEDNRFFFGRDELIQQLVEAVRQRALVQVIVGSSGSGKSSVVYAGLLPQLREDGKWLIAQTRPGSQPFQATAAALLPLLDSELSPADQLIETQKLSRALAQGEVTLESFSRQAVKENGESGRLLLLLDQFEEIYTLCPEDELRRKFLDQLLAAAESSGRQRTPPLVFLLTLRADFMGQALSHRPFADALQDAAFMIGPMNVEELRLAIEKPAELQGAAFEEGLVARILNDVGQEPGHLPLLEFALTLLWEKQEDGWLTHADYEAIGQVEGALARYADQVMDELTEEEQEQARQIFVQLVRPGQGTEDTRRVATRSELGEAHWPLVRHLADCRLVVTGRDDADQETAEVVHEALIQRWGRLQEWMTADRVFRTWQERLRAGLGSWEASDQDEGALLRGGPLAEAEEWLTERGEQMSAAERKYIEASITLRQRQEQEREAQRQRELEAAQQLAETEARAASRIRRSARYLAGALIVAAVLAVLAFLASQRASRNAEEAEANFQLAATREVEAVGEAQARATAQADAEEQREAARRQASFGLAAQALSELEEGEQDRAVLLALEALEYYPYTSQAESALAEAVEAYVPKSTLFETETGHGVRSIAWSPDGKLIAASIGVFGEFHIGEIASMQEVQRITTNTERWCGVISLAWSPSSDQMASIYGEPTGDEMYCPDPAVWDAHTGEHLFSLQGHSSFETSVAWSPDGTRILSTDAEGTVKIWDGLTGAERLTFAITNTPWEPPASFTEAAFGFIANAAWSPDGSRIATVGEQGVVQVWDSASGDELIAFSAGPSKLNQVCWSPSGKRLATAGGDGLVRVWDAESGLPLFGLTGHEDEVHFIAWSPDGRHIASDDGTIRVWDANSGAELIRMPQGYPSPVIWSPSGEQLATGNRDIVNLWDLSREHFQLTGHKEGLYAAEWSPDGSFVATASFDGTVRIWDTTTGAELVRLEHEAMAFYLDLSPDGSRLATTAYLAPMRIWDVSSGQLQLDIPIPRPGSAVARPSWSPNGSRIFGSVFDYDHFEHFGVLYDAETGEMLYALKTEEDCWLDAAWSPDGEYFVTSCWVTEAENPPARIWNATTGQELLRLQSDGGKVYSVDWSPDGGYIVVGYEDGTVRVWNAATWEVTLTFAGHGTDNPIFSVRWSPDGSRVASGDSSGVVKAWDMAAGDEVLSFKSYGIIRTLSWSSDGTYLLAATEGSGVPVIQRAWQSTEQLIAHAYECCVTRELTQEERQQFALPQR